jgi:hypothetical protein
LLLSQGFGGEAALLFGFGCLWRVSSINLNLLFLRKLPLPWGNLNEKKKEMSWE